MVVAAPSVGDEGKTWRTPPRLKESPVGAVRAEAAVLILRRWKVSPRVRRDSRARRLNPLDCIVARRRVPGIDSHTAWTWVARL
ncbi:hypothetical protein NDU88_005643 [Pleurodeles waltl]|uniref:Uncharacterized protein n=1 Tax=Pleurodeles waltl TaxID=8319 RepID=A0AAV7TBC9_PLEWA|nr:hypothetical protein NDU88_005643 [Pleurodeles waltl]